MSQEKHISTCFSCKLITVAVTGGIGIYLFKLGRKQKSMEKYVYYFLGAGSLSTSAVQIRKFLSA